MSEIVEVVAKATRTVTGSQSVPPAERAPFVNPQPKLEEFLRIVPIGQTRSDGTVTFTLLALEVYADGCIVTYQMITRTGEDLMPTHHPMIAIAAKDDRGGEYKGWSMGSGGGGGDGVMRWRGAQSLKPTLDPQARELTIELRIGWRPRDAPVGYRPPLVEGDPWVFAVPLA